MLSRRLSTRRSTLVLKNDLALRFSTHSHKGTQSPRDRDARCTPKNGKEECFRNRRKGKTYNFLVGLWWLTCLTLSQRPSDFSRLAVRLETLFNIIRLVEQLPLKRLLLRPVRLSPRYCNASACDITSLG